MDRTAPCRGLEGQWGHLSARWGQGAGPGVGRAAYAVRCQPRWWA